MMETRRGRESGRGTAENETLLTAQRSWRVSTSRRKGERAEEHSRSEKGHENQWAQKPNQVLLAKAQVNVGQLQTGSKLTKVKR